MNESSVSTLRREEEDFVIQARPPALSIIMKVISWGHTVLCFLLNVLYGPITQAT